MNYEVNKQTKCFWLAHPEQWVEFYGHEITIGKYCFAVGATKGGLLISEITTGMRIKTLPYNLMSRIMGHTKEGTLDYYEIMVVPWLRYLVKNNDMDTALKEGQERINALNIGKMPTIEDFDDSLITEPFGNIQ